jgi:putative DNA primase/helicase
MTRPSAKRSFATTDTGNAERFADQHRDKARFVTPWGKWIYFTGQRWKLDAKAEIEMLAKATVLSIDHEVAREADETKKSALRKHAGNSQSARGRTNMLRLAQCELAIEPSVLDNKPMLLNCTNGTVDLKTGERRAFKSEDFLTQQCPVRFDTRAKCPRWEQFLRSIFGNDMELVQFMQRLLGYFLTGSVSAHVLPILHGNGANGKTTLIETFLSLLGDDYSAVAPRDLLIKQLGNVHPTSRATLFGKRFVSASELERGSELAVATVKELVGGDTISARRMHEDWWNFKPTHKIAVATNHKPGIKRKDDAIWRRVLLIPFTVTIPPGDRDHDLLTTLRGELPGILAWCVRGCSYWRDNGHKLSPPAAVKNATDEYRQEEDELSPFLSEMCDRGSQLKCQASVLREAFKTWTESEITDKEFYLLMKEQGYTSKRGKRCSWYHGIGLRAAAVASQSA